MKLQKQVSYKYGDTIHYKYVIIIPENMITELGWQKNDELDAKVNNRELVIKSRNINH